MNCNEIIVNAFKKEVGHVVNAYGIRRTVKDYGRTGPFTYLPRDLDLVEFLQEVFPEKAES